MELCFFVFPMNYLYQLNVEQTTEYTEDLLVCLSGLRWKRPVGKLPLKVTERIIPFRITVLLLL